MIQLKICQRNWLVRNYAIWILINHRSFFDKFIFASLSIRLLFTWGQKKIKLSFTFSVSSHAIELTESINCVMLNCLRMSLFFFCAKVSSLLIGFILYRFFSLLVFGFGISKLFNRKQTSDKQKNPYCVSHTHHLVCNFDGVDSVYFDVKRTKKKNEFIRKKNAR